MSWEQLKAIIDEDKAEARKAKNEPPGACPIDGAILEVRGNVRNCPMGNYRWPEIS